MEPFLFLSRIQESFLRCICFTANMFGTFTLYVRGSKQLSSAFFHWHFCGWLSHWPHLGGKVTKKRAIPNNSRKPVFPCLWRMENTKDPGSSCSGAAQKEQGTALNNFHRIFSQVENPNTARNRQKYGALPETGTSRLMGAESERQWDKEQKVRL